jgi:hypothetical protein
MQVSGNVDPQTLELFSNLPILFGLNNNKKPGFADSIIQRLVVTHASLEKKAEEPLKQEGKVVCELVVTDGAYLYFLASSFGDHNWRNLPDMLNGGNLPQ